MADVQKYFEQFHSTIRADYDLNKILREKRDVIVDLVQKSLKEKSLPCCEVLLQGSYAVRTGIYPIEKLEFDIDVGLRFPFKETAYTATVVRDWIFSAVDGHTKSVEKKGACIRVNYSDNYHVDLVSYACWTDSNGQGQCKLASKSEGWRPADPAAMLDYVKSARKRFEGTEDSGTKTDQLRRVVRYLKRWNDEAIPFEAPYKATGLAWLLLAINMLNVSKSWDGTPDDRNALENLASGVASIYGRLALKKPFPEYEDVFGCVSDKEMSALKERFGKLRDALIAANQTIDPVKACTTLKSVFGRDFPVPEPEDTAKKTYGPAIVTSSSSARR
jgi:hypothetical protein